MYPGIIFVIKFAIYPPYDDPIRIMLFAFIENLFMASRMLFIISIAANMPKFWYSFFFGFNDAGI